MAKAKRTRSAQVKISSGGGIPGWRVFDPQAAVDLVTPDYQKHTLPFVGKIVPCIDDLDDEGNPCPKRFVPYRTGHDEAGFTNFFYRAPVVRSVGIGDDKQTFILYDPSEPVDVDDTLYGILFRRISRALSAYIKEEDKYKVQGLYGEIDVRPWQRYWFGEKIPLQQQAFCKPNRLSQTFMATLPLIDRGKLTITHDRQIAGTNRGDRAQILMISDACEREVLGALNSPGSEDFHPDDDNILSGYLHNDVTQFGPDGKFMVLYNPEHHDISGLVPKELGIQGPLDGDDEEEAVWTPESADVGGQGFASYSVMFVDYVRVAAKSGTSTRRVKLPHKEILENDAVRRAVLEKYLPIHEYFWIPTDEQQALYLATAFRKLPSVLYYGFADTPSFWTDDVLALLKTPIRVPSGNVQDEDDSDQPADVGEDRGGFLGGLAVDDDDDNDPLPVKAPVKVLAKATKPASVTQQAEVYPVEELPSAAPADNKVRRVVKTAAAEAGATVKKVVKKAAVKKVVVKKAAPKGTAKG